MRLCTNQVPQTAADFTKYGYNYYRWCVACTTGTLFSYRLCDDTLVARSYNYGTILDIGSYLEFDALYGIESAAIMWGSACLSGGIQHA